jgi:hypothetical protein
MADTTTIRTPITVHAPGLRSVEEAAEWLDEQRRRIQSQLSVAGAIRLRGLPFRDAAGFALLRDKLIARPSNYVEKATPRTAYGDNVFTATDFPARRTIHLHNENSYANEFPGVLLFGCLIAPATGGATTLGDMAALIRLLPPELLHRFRSTGWRLVRNYWGHLGLPWQLAFDTDDPDTVANYGRQHDLEVSWIDNRLRTTQTRNATVRHPLTSEECWFNHIAFWSRWSLDEEVRELLRTECGDDLPYDTSYGDGEPIDRTAIDVVNAAYAEVRVTEQWQRGDLLVVDNILMAHGRSPYTGPREVLVALGDPIDRATCDF